MGSFMSFTLATRHLVRGEEYVAYTQLGKVSTDS